MFSYFYMSSTVMVTIEVSGTALKLTATKVRVVSLLDR